MDRTKEAEFVAERDEDILDLGDAISETEGEALIPGETDVNRPNM